MSYRNREDLRHSVPVTYLAHLVNLASRWGVSEQELLTDSDIDISQFSDETALVSVAQIGRIAQRLMAISGREDLGIAYGLQLRPTSHGFIGYTVLSCENYFHALKVLQKYQVLLINDFVFAVEVGNEEVVFDIHSEYDFGSMRRTYFESLLVGFCAQSALALGHDIQGWTIETDWPKPSYFDTYCELLPHWKFEQCGIRIRFPKALLSRPLIMADPIAAKMAIAQLDRDAKAPVGEAQSDAVRRVKEILRVSTNGFPSLAAVAKQMFMSERSLGRKLSKEHTQFQQLLDKERLERAISLMRNKQLSLQIIAQNLGYTDPAAFARAFKRWTGKSPSVFRDS